MVRVIAGRPVVQVPRLASGEFGPLGALALPAPAGGSWDAIEGRLTASFVAGDRVLVAMVEGRPGDLVVIARLV